MYHLRNNLDISSGRYLLKNNLKKKHQDETAEETSHNGLLVNEKAEVNYPLEKPQQETNDQNYSAALNHDSKTPDDNVDDSISKTSGRMAAFAGRVYYSLSAGKVFEKTGEERTNRRNQIKARMRQLAKERMTIRQIFRRYVKSSTLHGFRYVCSDTHLLRRALWVCLMLTGAVFFLHKLHEGVVSYYKYPFNTKHTRLYQNPFPLPAFSFCPANQFNMARLRDSPLLPLYEADRLPLRKNWSDPGFDISGDNLTSAIDYASVSMQELLADCDYIRKDTNSPSKPPNYCGASNFRQYFSSSGQKCFTLNSGKPGHPMLQVDADGIQNGFEVMFDLRSAEMVATHAYNGVEVHIHHQHEPPTFNKGFLLTPGYKTLVKMQKVETHNLPPPYAMKCGSRELKHHKVYNRKACLLERLTEYVDDKCQCRAAYMPGNDMPICSLTKSFLCMFSAIESFNELANHDSCPVNCVEVDFDPSVSQNAFLHSPRIGFEPIILQNAAWARGKNTSRLLELHERYQGDDLEMYIEENVIVALFYFDSMASIINTQAPSYTFYNFLGDTGGSFAIMLGASLLTFVEFIDLLVFLGYHQLLRLQKQHEI